MLASRPLYSHLHPASRAHAALVKPWTDRRAQIAAALAENQELRGKQRRLWGAVAGACAFALVSFVHGFECPQPVHQVRVEAVEEQVPRLVAWTDAGVQVEPAAGHEKGPTHVKGQKTAPCDRDVELEVSGSCWIMAPRPPPCVPGKTVEWAGRCLAPVSQPVRTPTSAEP